MILLHFKIFSWQENKARQYFTHSLYFSISSTSTYLESITGYTGTGYCRLLYEL